MAKKFQFRLETVLKLKTEKVEEAKNSLYIALRHRYEKEQKIEVLQKLKNEQITKQNNLKKAQEMQAFKDHINSLNTQIEYEEKEKEKIIEIENARRMRLNEAMQEEKVITKLKEKKIEEHKQELKREETNFLDEIATQQYIRK